MSPFEWLLFAVSTLALMVISATMLPRANDLRWRKKWYWKVRLIGLVLAGVAPVGTVIYEFAYLTAPSPYEVMFRVGLACVFFTTPGMPPWTHWVFGIKGGDEVYYDGD